MLDGCCHPGIEQIMETYYNSIWSAALIGLPIPSRARA